MIDIEIEHLSKSYVQNSREIGVLQDIHLRIEPGEFFFLLGPSGCGKTTLLRILAGLLEPSAGRIRFSGRDVTYLTAEKRRCAMVFQNYALWPHLTVGKNVEFGPAMQGKTSVDCQRIALEKLSMVQMQDYIRRKPNQLSGGQQQRVALARALAADPQCLLLDEPLSNLDAQLRSHMRRELCSLVKPSGTTTVYVTHDRKEALAMADRIAILHQGRLLQVGTPQEVYTRPYNEFVAAFIGRANFLKATVESVNPALLKTELGQVRIQSTNGVSAGRSITCCIRPEHILLAEKGTSDANNLVGTISDITYFGGTRQLAVRFNETLTWDVRMFSSAGSDYHIGQKIFCRVKPEHVVLLTGAV